MACAVVFGNRHAKSIGYEVRHSVCMNVRHQHAITALCIVLSLERQGYHSRVRKVFLEDRIGTALVIVQSLVFQHAS